MLPTNLGDLEAIKISGTDQIFAAVSEYGWIVFTRRSNLHVAQPDCTWIYPGPLDIKRLKIALSQTLRDYPHAAGRLQYESQTQKWYIKLTNEGVPITLGTTNLPYAPDEWFHTNERHPDLIGKEYYFAKCITILKIIDPMPMSFHPLELNNEPLLRFKLVNWETTGETSLSVAFCHLLGLCQFYFCRLSA